MLGQLYLPERACQGNALSSRPPVVGAGRKARRGQGKNNRQSTAQARKCLRRKGDFLVVTSRFVNGSASGSHKKGSGFGRSAFARCASARLNLAYGHKRDGSALQTRRHKSSPPLTSSIFFCNKMCRYRHIVYIYNIYTMKIRKRGLTNPKRYVILWLTMCVADTGYFGYRTINGGIAITIKPRLHRYCTEVFLLCSQILG